MLLICDVTSHRYKTYQISCRLKVNLSYISVRRQTKNLFCAISCGFSEPTRYLNTIISLFFPSQATVDDLEGLEGLVGAIESIGVLVF